MKISKIVICCLVAKLWLTLLQAPELQHTKLLYPWNFPGKNIGMGCHFLLQGICPTQVSNLGHLQYKQVLYHLSHRRSPIWSTQNQKLCAGGQPLLSHRDEGKCPKIRSMSWTKISPRKKSANVKYWWYPIKMMGVLLVLEIFFVSFQISSIEHVLSMQLKKKLLQKKPTSSLSNAI